MGDAGSAAAGGKKAQKLGNGWYAAYSAKHGRLYYFNRTTNQRQWTEPEELKIKLPPRDKKPSPTSAASTTSAKDNDGGTVVSPHSSSSTASVSPGQDWTEHWDDKRKRNYYFNKRTGQSSWENPALIRARNDSVRAQVFDEVDDPGSGKPKDPPRSNAKSSSDDTSEEISLSSHTTSVTKVTLELLNDENGGDSGDDDVGKADDGKDSSRNDSLGASAQPNDDDLRNAVSRAFISRNSSRSYRATSDDSGYYAVESDADDDADADPDREANAESADSASGRGPSQENGLASEEPLARAHTEKQDVAPDANEQSGRERSETESFDDRESSAVSDVSEMQDTNEDGHASPDGLDLDDDDLALHGALKQRDQVPKDEHSAQEQNTNHPSTNASKSAAPIDDLQEAQAEPAQQGHDLDDVEDEVELDAKDEDDDDLDAENEDDNDLDDDKDEGEDEDEDGLDAKDENEEEDNGSDLDGSDEASSAASLASSLHSGQTEPPPDPAAAEAPDGAAPGQAQDVDDSDAADSEEDGETGEEDVSPDEDSHSQILEIQEVGSPTSAVSANGSDKAASDDDDDDNASDEPRNETMTRALTPKLARDTNARSRMGSEVGMYKEGSKGADSSEEDAEESDKDPEEAADGSSEADDGLDQAPSVPVEDPETSQRVAVDADSAAGDSIASDNAADSADAAKASPPHVETKSSAHAVQSKTSAPHGQGRKYSQQRPAIPPRSPRSSGSGASASPTAAPPSPPPSPPVAPPPERPPRPAYLRSSSAPLAGAHGSEPAENPFVTKPQKLGSSILSRINRLHEQHNSSQRKVRERRKSLLMLEGAELPPEEADNPDAKIVITQTTEKEVLRVSVSPRASVAAAEDSEQAQSFATDDDDNDSEQAAPDVHSVQVPAVTNEDDLEPADEARLRSTSLSLRRTVHRFSTSLEERNQRHVQVENASHSSGGWSADEADRDNDPKEPSDAKSLTAESPDAQHNNGDHRGSRTLPPEDTSTSPAGSPSANGDARPPHLVVRNANGEPENASEEAFDVDVDAEPSNFAPSFRMDTNGELLVSLYADDASPWLSLESDECKALADDQDAAFDEGYTSMLEFREPEHTWIKDLEDQDGYLDLLESLVAKVEKED